MDVGNDSIDIQNSLADELQQKLLELAREQEGEKFTIFRVPYHIRQNNKQLYEPRIVSIGPYYYKDDAFQAMEKHKLRYLRDYLSRNTRNSINHCINKLRGLESRARRCYFEDVKLESEEFLKMMLLDGCFIIEFLIKLYHPHVQSDEIFDVGWVLPILRNDLLLLENQIPFFVIQELFNLIVPRDGNALVRMLLKYLSEEYLSEEEKADTQKKEKKEKEKEEHILAIGVEIKHILHMYHLCYVRSPTAESTKSFHIKEWLSPIKLPFVHAFLLKLGLRRKTNSMNERDPHTIPSATELQEAGITFKRNMSNKFLDIKFQNGILEIPFVTIEDTRRSRLLNLVSFEQYNANISKPCNTNPSMNLTSYACFMGSLFKSAKDVTLLTEKGIIENLLATNEELVSFFNWVTMCSYLDYEDPEANYLKDVVINVNRYYNSDWHKWRARLKRDYFANPWSTISFIAACVLLVLAALQTLYSVLAFYK
ncbi:hypothetical protein LUZ61_019987 [Rhynchospora tenuis]|uniref:Uncharacterized protein n=1 Tax=Rhynchospora tenuis TaxID=198213 RepID=A0AAD5ZC75_9POAL|nr:hypothetical protein LUZ61_019987 [Rhynchospora tenuis]